MQLSEGLAHKLPKYFLGDYSDTCFAHTVCVSWRKTEVHMHVLPFSCKVSGTLCHTFLKCNLDAIHQCSAHGSTHKTVLLARDVPSTLWPRSQPGNTPLGCPILIVILPELCPFPRLSKGQSEVCTPLLMGARSLLLCSCCGRETRSLYISLSLALSLPPSFPLSCACSLSLPCK